MLAGGLGTRLGELTSDCPKPMLDIDGRPFLETIVENLKYFGITEIILSIGYLSKVIIGHFGDGSKFGVNISYVIEDTPAGTGGVLDIARDRLDDVFLMMNGDTLFDVNFHKLYQLLISSDATGVIAMRQLDEVSRYGAIQYDGNQILNLSEKGKSGPGCISGGIYIFRNKVLDYVKKAPLSLETDVLPSLIDDNTLLGMPFNGFFIDIGIPESLKSAQSEIPNWKKKAMVFLDRDGVINIDHGYVADPERFDWVDGATDAISLLNASGYRVVVVTNQAGIARGFYTEEQFLNFANWIDEQLALEGGNIDAWYYCPYHTEAALDEYKKDSHCRKPNPGMLEKAIKEFEPDLKKSFLIGDKSSDIEAANRVGVHGYLFDQHANLHEFVADILANCN